MIESLTPYDVEGRDRYETGRKKTYDTTKKMAGRERTTALQKALKKIGMEPKKPTIDDYPELKRIVNGG